jgi:DNA-binding NarL/FixJ family response regulator
MQKQDRVVDRQPVSFVVNDDSPETCEHFRRRLTPALGVRCLGWTTDLAEARPLVERTGPDVVLLDLLFPEGEALDLIAPLRALRHDLKVVMISGVVRHGYINRALNLGAAGYLSKDQPPDDLAAVIRRGAAGELTLGAAATAEYLSRPQPIIPPPPSPKPADADGR